MMKNILGQLRPKEYKLIVNSKEQMTLDVTCLFLLLCNALRVKNETGAVGVCVIKSSHRDWCPFDERHNDSTPIGCLAGHI